MAVAGALVVSLAGASSASAGFVDLGTAFSGVQTTRPTFSVDGSGIAFGLHRPTGRGYVVRLFSGAWTPYQALTAPGRSGTPVVFAGTSRDPAYDGTPAVPSATWSGDAASPGLYSESQDLSGRTPPTLNVLPDPRFASGDVPGDTAIANPSGYPSVLSRGPGGKGIYLGQAQYHDPDQTGWTVSTVTDHDVQPGVFFGTDQSPTSVIWSERRTTASGASYAVILVSYVDPATGGWTTPVERRFAAGSSGTELGVEGLSVSTATYSDRTTVAYLRTRTVHRADGSVTRSSAVQTLDLANATRSWGSVRTVAPDAVDPQRSAPRLATLSYGQKTPGAVVTWTSSAPGAPAGASARTAVMASSRPVVGAWSAPAEISSPSAGASAGVSGVQLATNADQDVITASWREASGGWVARDWEPWSGRWEDRTVRIPGMSTDDVQMVVSSPDTAFAAFDAARGRANVVVDDASGPAMASIGGITKAGATTYLSVDPVDTYSKVTDVTWDLGDGTTAHGAQVEHVYPLGTYHVTVTATDELGNQTVRTGTYYANACGQRTCTGAAAASTATARSAARAEVAPRTPAAAPVARRVSRIRLAGGRLRMHVSGEATMEVHLLRRSVARGSRRAGWRPMRTIHLLTSGAGPVALPVRGVRAGGTYRVVLGGVRVGASKQARTVTRTLKATHR